MDHERHTSLRAGPHHSLGILYGWRERLLADHRNPLRGSQLHQGAVGRRLRYDIHEIEALLLQHLGGIGVPARHAELARKGFGPPPIAIADRRDLSPVYLSPATNMVACKETAADQPAPQILHVL